MNKIEVAIYFNTTSDEQALLIDNNVVVIGDDYHNNIDGVISGFIKGLEYCGYEVVENYYKLSPEDSLFDKIGFYDDSDCIEYDDEDSAK